MLITKTSFYTPNAPKQTQRIQAQPKADIKFGMDAVVYLPSRATSEYVSQTVKHSAGKLLTGANQKILVGYVTQAVASAVQEGTLNEKNHQSVRVFVNRTIQEALKDNEAAVSKSLTKIIENTITNLFENNKKRMNRIFQQNFYPLRQMGVGSGMAAAGYYVLPSIASSTMSNTVLGAGLATATLGAFNIKSSLGKPLNTDPKALEEMINAVDRNDPDAILELVRSKKIDINGYTDYGMTPLFGAAATGNDKALQQLIDLGADIDKPGLMGENSTALWAAARSGNLTSVKALVEAGANINTHGVQNPTPLWSAIQHNHTEIALMLLAHGADPNLGVLHNTPLQLAEGVENRRIIHAIEQALKNKQ